MQCARCTGLRVPEIISEGGARVLALRCINCGDVIDPVIVRHRRRVGQSTLRLCSVGSRGDGVASPWLNEPDGVWGHPQSDGEGGKEA
jgi:hypothetical protein